MYFGGNFSELPSRRFAPLVNLYAESACSQDITNAEAKAHCEVAGET